MTESTLLSQAGEALHMFLFLGAELTVLFLLISYIVGWLQVWISPARVQSILSSKNGKGYVIAAALGAVTPFCSCSTIPFLKGLLRARAGFGPMTVFLFSSPLMNPIIIGLFFVTFGWQVALLYFVMAMGVSVAAGYIFEKLGFERYVKREAVESTTSEASSCCDAKPESIAAPEAAASCCGPKVEEKSPCCGSAPAASSCCDTAPAASSCCDTAPAASSCCDAAPAASSCCDAAPQPATRPTWLRVWFDTWKDFKQVLPYLLIGIAIGSLIYGFLPSEFLASVAGQDNLWSIPIAAVVGVPLYIRAEAVIPLSAALVAKGMSMSAVMALIIGSAGASLTEVILLKSLFKTKMIIAFLLVVFTMATGAGLAYNFIFA